MIVQHTVNRRGAEYTYFFCRNKQNGTCHAPHINVALIEDAVEAHYASIRFSAQFIADVRAHIARVIDEQDVACQGDGTASLSRGWDHLEVSLSIAGLPLVSGSALWISVRYIRRRAEDSPR